MDKLKISADSRAKILSQLHELRHNRAGPKWVLLGYDGDSLVLRASGRGAVSELTPRLARGEVLYAVLECMVQGDALGDDLNAIKYLFVRWVGPDVPPGLYKARASGHAKDLLDLVQQEVGISAQFEPATLDDINADNIAQCLARRRWGEKGSAGADVAHERRAQLSEKYDKKLSGLLIVDEGACAGALKAASAHGSGGFAAFRYVEGKRDDVALAGQGTDGLDGIRRVLNEDEIFYVYFVFSGATDRVQKLEKSILMTYVGENVTALKKARSSGHREPMKEWVLSHVQMHSQYQANSMADLNMDSILFKIRS